MRIATLTAIGLVSALVPPRLRRGAAPGALGTGGPGLA